MENMSRWHMRPARSSALPCPACFPIVCLDAACKMNSGLWTMLDCLTSPNMTLTANSKIQGPNLPTAYLPHHVPATAFHQCIVHQLVTSQWVLFHLLEHAQCLSVAALAAKCCKHKLELLTASRLLAVKHPYEEWILMNIGPNLPTMWPRDAPQKFGSGRLQQITILTVALQYCWITSARHGVMAIPAGCPNTPTCPKPQSRGKKK